MDINSSGFTGTAEREVPSIYDGMRVEVFNQERRLLFEATLKTIESRLIVLERTSELYVPDIGEVTHVRLRGFHFRENRGIYMEGRLQRLAQVQDKAWIVEDLVFTGTDTGRTYTRKPIRAMGWIQPAEAPGYNAGDSGAGDVGGEYSEPSGVQLPISAASFAASSSREAESHANNVPLGAAYSAAAVHGTADAYRGPAEMVLTSAAWNPPYYKVPANYHAPDPAEGIWTECTVNDASAGGVRFRTAVQMETGTRLWIRFKLRRSKAQPPLACIVRRVMERDGEYEYGCQFTDTSDEALTIITRTVIELHVMQP